MSVFFECAIPVLKKVNFRVLLEECFEESFVDDEAPEPELKDTDRIERVRAMSCAFSVLMAPHLMLITCVDSWYRFIGEPEFRSEIVSKCRRLTSRLGGNEFVIYSEHGHVYPLFWQEGCSKLNLEDVKEHLNLRSSCRKFSPSVLSTGPPKDVGLMYFEFLTEPTGS